MIGLLKSMDQSIAINSRFEVIAVITIEYNRTNHCRCGRRLFLL